MPRVKTVGRAKWRSAQTEYLSKADDQSQIGYPPFALEEISQPLCLLMADSTPSASSPEAAARRQKALGGQPRRVQISICSEISKASSTSMPKYRTVDSSLE